MEIIRIKKLFDFQKKHADARTPLKVWINVIQESRFNTPAELKAVFPTADFVQNENITDLIIFNIKGNSYSLVAEVNYEGQYISVIFIGTHAEYDKIDFRKTGG